MKQLLKSVVLGVAILASTLAIAAKQNILLVVLPGCEYCNRAETILNHAGVKYHTAVSKGGTVPRLYVNGKYKGTGVDAVQAWLQANRVRTH